MHEGLHEGLSLLALLFARIDALPGQVVDIATIAVSIAVTMRCPECALRLSCVLAFGVLV